MPNERGLRESGFFVAETVDRLGSGSRTPADVARSVRAGDGPARHRAVQRSEEHTSELQSLMRISYAVFCLKKKNHVTGRQGNYDDADNNQQASNHLTISTLSSE